MRSLALLLVLGSLSCGTGRPEIPPELLPSPEGGANGGGDAYPAPPYGSTEGSVIPNLEFSGYPDPRAGMELTPISFSDFYDADGSSDRKLLLLNTAAAWCQPCRIEHAELPARYESYREQGVEFFSLLFQDSSGNPASEATLELWTQSYQTNFPIALDPSFQMGLFGSAENPPLNLVIDVREMKILKQFVGNQDEALFSYIDQILSESSTKEALDE